MNKFPKKNTNGRISRLGHTDDRIFLVPDTVVDKLQKFLVFQGSQALSCGAAGCRRLVPRQLRTGVHLVAASSVKRWSLARVPGGWKRHAQTQVWWL